MKSDPDVGNDSLSNQLMKLIIRPLKDTNSHMVIIVDALDECKDDEPASALLSLLSQSIDDLPTVKFFMTGRPEPQIRAGFRLRSLRPHTEILLLHEVEDESIDQDIETFLRTGLDTIADQSETDVDQGRKRRCCPGPQVQRPLHLCGYHPQILELKT